VRLSRATVAFSLLFTASIVFSESADRHLTSDQAHVLYQRSAFAHGYIHGYEDGFHDADMDLQMGRGERPLKVQKDYRDASNGYSQDHGDKNFFHKGYRQGFKEGYSDSIRGRQFRAIDETRNAAEGMADPSLAKLKEKDFDRAFSVGYDEGYDRSSTENMQSADFSYAANSCESQLPRTAAALEGEYCDAFTRGFSLGLSDGEAGRVNLRTQTAQK